MCSAPERPSELALGREGPDPPQVDIFVICTGAETAMERVSSKQPTKQLVQAYISSLI